MTPKKDRLAPNMDNNFAFYRTSMPPSRPADYHLGCLDGSAYLDFDLLKGNRIRLTRLSFDGFGCCDLGRRAKPMKETDSVAFTEIMDQPMIDQTRLAEIIKKTIRRNRDLLWEDALEEYGFTR